MDKKNLILNEMYFGKTPAILKIERSIGKIRQKYMGQYRDKEILNDPEVLNLEKYIQEAFGFDLVDVSFEFSTIPNAYTIATSVQVDTLPKLEDLTVTSHDGIRFKKEAKYATLIVIFTGLLLNPILSDEEVTAVLLHEIGHNFTSAILPSVAVVTRLSLFAYILSSTYSIFTIFVASNAGIRANANFTKFLSDKAPGVKNILDFTAVCFSAYKDLLIEFIKSIDVLLTLTNPPLSLMVKILNVSKIKFGNAIGLINTSAAQVRYSDEQFADSFAAMYGYGPALASCLEKMQDTPVFVADKLINKIPLLANFYELFNAPLYFLLYGLDEHPETIARLKHIMNAIETDLKDKKVSPAMQKRLKQDFAEIKAKLSEYETKSNRANSTILDDPTYVKKAYRSMLLDIFGTGDLRGNINKIASPKNIDSIFDKIKFK